MIFGPSIAPQWQVFSHSLQVLHSDQRLMPKIVIFDRFLPNDVRLGRFRHLLNAGARWFGTDINRRLGDLLADSGYLVAQNLPSLVRGLYRIVVVTSTYQA